MIGFRPESPEKENPMESGFQYLLYRFIIHSKFIHATDGFMKKSVV